ADVLGPVGGREAEVLVEAVADVVAVEDEGVHVALPERLLERHRDGGLPRAGEAGEPDRGAAVPAQARPIGPRDSALVADDVGRLLLGHRACPLSLSKRTVQTMRA